MDKEQYLKLENQLCFSLYACSKEVMKLYRSELERFDMTFPQYLVMLVLWEHEKLTVNELGKHLFLDSGTLTPMLKRMEAVQLVERVRLKEDERKVLITPTKKGRALKEAIACVPERIAPQFHLTQEEYLQLLKQLQTITAQLQSN
ncbi:MarR family transcriptional regulator [Bacillus sp. 165]|uniref:MarR family winged helix-turn-helix transcriptional regulator n=1 Tax=Bacillus sp. 165 TaxID=1529117 RepID=UPI001AD98BAC|nr:MarR family transcriptional regulator [Bacillus sp. 165]MBO9130667.1 MarR family transcriptional regulator [Bacillus sp. 165]